jgi:hypothetical protein
LGLRLAPKPPKPERTQEMIYTSHGGECCGISHVYDFAYEAFPAWIKNLEQIIANHEAAGKTRLLEAVLTDEQCRPWKKVLEEHGFVLVSRFINSNTRRACNVFHRANCRTFDAFVKGEKPQKTKASKTDTPEVRAVTTFYTAHFRDGSRGALCDSLDAAEERFPRATRYCRFVIFSDGTSRYVDGTEGGVAAVPVRG